MYYPIKALILKLGKIQAGLYGLAYQFGFAHHFGKVWLVWDLSSEDVCTFICFVNLYDDMLS